MKRIPLTQDKYALVDDEDFERINQYKWYANNEHGIWYAIRSIRKTNGKQTIQRMHRIIMDAPNGFETDHVNHDGLDNRKRNLRICTHAENQHNRKLQDGTSKFKGVSWHEATKKWQAKITSNGKLIHLGVYDNEITAALAYNIKAKDLFGDFVYLNFK